MSQKSMLWCRVDNPVRELVETLAKTKGISISEYVRNLVLEDLDKRSFFTTKIKEGLGK